MISWFTIDFKGRLTNWAFLGSYILNSIFTERCRKSSNYMCHLSFLQYDALLKCQHTTITHLICPLIWPASMDASLANVLNVSEYTSQKLSSEGANPAFKDQNVFQWRYTSWVFIQTDLMREDKKSMYFPAHNMAPLSSSYKFIVQRCGM